MSSKRLRARAFDLWPVFRALLILCAIVAWLTAVVKTALNGPVLLWPAAWVPIGVIVGALVLTGSLGGHYRRALGLDRKWWMLAFRMTLLIGVPVIAALVVLYLPFSNRVDWTLVLVSIGLVGLWPIAAEFSRPTLRLAAVGFVIGSFVLLLYVGNAALKEDWVKHGHTGAPPSSSVIDVLRAGSNALLHRVPGESSNVALQTAGWVLLAVLALLWYRALEIRGIKHGIGPVRIEAGDSLQGDDEKATVGEFTVAVLQNVPEPGSTPGSETTTTVTDIIAAAPDPTRVIEKAIAAVVSVIRPSARYRVVVDYLTPREDDGHHIGVARIFDARTGYSLDTIRESDESKRKALSAAAYSTAGWILERSDRVPSWAAWSHDSSRALAVYMENTTGAGANIDDDTLERSVDDLRDAQIEAPRSGVLTVLAAHELDKAQKHADAVHLYVRAGVVHRRYLAARYRTAVGLHILAAKPHEYWWSASAGTRAAIVHGLRRLDRELKLGKGDDIATLESPSGSSCDWQHAMAHVAESHLHNLDDSYAWWAVGVNLLRRDERMFWWKLLRNRSRHRDRLMIEIACRSMHDRASENGHEHIEFDLERDRCWGCGRALYNLACWYLSQDPKSDQRARQVLELLEQARDEPDGRSLHREWLKQDPDLETLKDDPRFNALLDTLNA
jgi:hypothetical protein